MIPNVVSVTPCLFAGWLSVRGCTEHRVFGHGHSGEHATLPNS